MQDEGALFGYAWMRSVDLAPGSLLQSFRIYAPRLR